MSGHYSIFTDAGCTEIAFKFSPDLGGIHCNSRKIDKVSRKSRETQIEGSNQLLHIKKLLQSLRLETTVLLLLLPWLWAEYCGQRLVIAPQCLLHPEPESGNSWEWLASLFSWRRKWQPTAVFLPGESCGQGSLVGCHPWGRTEPDMTEATQHTCIYQRRKWQPTPVFLPGESQGRRSLVGCRLWGHTESDTTEMTQQQQQNLSRCFSGDTPPAWQLQIV